MTGFIKPAELEAAQKLLVGYMTSAGETKDDIPDEALEFLQIHPVTKNKENIPYKKVNGVYVTVNDFKQTEQRRPPLDMLED